VPTSHLQDNSIYSLYLRALKKSYESCRPQGCRHDPKVCRGKKQLCLMSVRLNVWAALQMGFGIGERVSLVIRNARDSIPISCASGSTIYHAPLRQGRESPGQRFCEAVQLDAQYVFSRGAPDTLYDLMEELRRVWGSGYSPPPQHGKLHQGCGTWAGASSAPSTYPESVKKCSSGRDRHL
jgi:hypothetical protein